MKTTIELPDDLARRVKMRAVERQQKLKDTIAQLLEAGLTLTRNPSVTETTPKPVRLKGIGSVGIDEIEAAIVAGRE